MVLLLCGPGVPEGKAELPPGGTLALVGMGNYLLKRGGGARSEKMGEGFSNLRFSPP